MTASRPDTELPIDVRGEVRLSGPGGYDVALSADGASVVLAAPNWSAFDALRLRSLIARRRALADGIRVLETLGLAMDVMVAGHRVCRFGRGVTATLLARVLGLRSTDIRLTTVISLLMQRASVRRAAR